MQDPSLISSQNLFSHQVDAFKRQIKDTLKVTGHSKIIFFVGFTPSVQEFLFNIMYLQTPESPVI